MTRPYLSTRQWRTLGYVDDPGPWRNVLVAVLLQACVDAYHGDEESQRYIYSADARDNAHFLGLPAWPPRPEQLAGLAGLRKRSKPDRVWVDESKGALSMRGKGQSTGGWRSTWRNYPGQARRAPPDGPAVDLADLDDQDRAALGALELWEAGR